MKVAIVTKTFPPFSFGGTESYSEQLAIELSKQDDVEVHVICFQSAPVPVPEEEVTQYRDSHPFTMHIAGVHFKDKSVLMDPKRMLALRNRILEIVEKIEPEIIQTIGVYSEAMMAVAVGAGKNIPTVAFPRGSDVQGKTGSITSHLMVTQVIKQVSLVMCQTQWMKDRLVAWKYLSSTEAASRSMVVPNAISLDTIDTDITIEDRKITTSEMVGPPTIVWIGRFEPVKRPGVAIELFRAVRPSLPTGSNLVMIGDGSLWTEINEKVKDDESIILTGRLNPDEISLHLEKSSLLINTSESEGFPQTFLEAMVHGVPIVCFDVTANSEIVEQGVNGFVIDPADHTEFRTAIERILTDRGERERMSRANRKKAKQYSWDEILPTILDVYEKLITAERMKPEKKGWLSNILSRTRK